MHELGGTEVAARVKGSEGEQGSVRAEGIQAKQGNAALKEEKKWMMET